MDAMATCRSLTKRFGKTEAVKGLDLDIPSGAVTAFLGPNGAGKTTTIKCLLNLLTPSSGTSSVLGTPSHELGPAQFRQIGYVSENQELPLWMTVAQFIDYCRPLYPAWDRDLEAKLRRQFGLPEKAKLKALSRGMRVKAVLLSSLAYRPRFLVLDEPFSGLDPLVRDEFIEGMLELVEQDGWTAFMSSHDIDDVERLADHVVIIDEGRLQLNESVDDLRRRFRAVDVTLSEDAAELAGSLPPTWLNAAVSGKRLSFTDSAYDSDSLARDIAMSVPCAADHRVSPMSLRLIFVALARTYRLREASA